MSKTVKRYLQTLLGVVVASFIFLSSQATLFADATLVSSAPADNQVIMIADAPSQVTLTFSEKLKPGDSTIDVIDTVRNSIIQGPGAVNDKQITVQLNKGLAATDYSVEYSVVADANGAVTRGSYNFKLVPPAGNPLEPGYLFSTPTAPIGSQWAIYFPWALVFLVVFLVGAIIANYFYFFGKYRYRNNRLTYTVFNRASRNAAIAFSLGIFFFLCRVGNLQPFNARLWLYLTVILLVYYMIRGVIWRSRVYPKAKAEYLEQVARARRRNPETVSASGKVPAVKIVPTGTLASGSGDAGGDTKLSGPPLIGNKTEGSTPSEMPRGLSPRGQKRRDKKRDRR